ncbi:hypothetical protein [Candidatus Viridilinea mediisalina]|uniref:Uncharacterized protein n=1 Tax=Candidatus Viridilinea mediisalina TaxID=2024553 RepID=A0A2A6RF69_9CHLR|nr:hypothetical protein [Candidatus Viridilinea mediisalina]PDW01581.1 hypothetical protein CJ255_18425 [Candidatus Viridilinea mediisalina]
MRSLPRPLARAIGIVLLATAALGLLLSAVGLLATFSLTRQAEMRLLGALEALDEALQVTSEGLDVAHVALVDTNETLTSLSQTFVSVSRTITETRPIIGTLASVSSQDLPQTINATRQTLATAQETAQVVDGVLGALNIFGLRYSPEQTLSSAIGNVSSSLATLPVALNEVATGLQQANRNLAIVADDLNTVTSGLDSIALSVNETTNVITRYQAVVDELQGEVVALQADVPGWFTAVRLVMSMLLLWLALAQLVLITRGWELLSEG